MTTSDLFFIAFTFIFFSIGTNYYYFYFCYIPFCIYIHVLLFPNPKSRRPLIIWISVIYLPDFKIPQGKVNCRYVDTKWWVCTTGCYLNVIHIQLTIFLLLFIIYLSLSLSFYCISLNIDTSNCITNYLGLFFLLLFYSSNSSFLNILGLKKN